VGRAASSRLREAQAANRCYVIAEAGSNHNRDWNLAAGLIRVAAEAGADAVKFQLFRAARLYPRNAGQAAYLEDATDIYEIVSALELPEDWLPRLAEACAEADLDFLVTPFDESAADAIDEYVPAFKVASYELTHEPLVRHIAAKGKPMIMSTGAATLEEVEAAIGAARAAGATDITLLQCTAAYPARLEALNVSALAELRRRFGVPVGLSDHSRDPIIAPVLAVGLGASVIEKHFTIDPSLPGPDHRFALDPGELVQLVEAVRSAESAMGSGHKGVHTDEEELRAFARRSLFALRNIDAGETFDESAVGALRNGVRSGGLPPSALAGVLGKRAARAIPAGEPLTAADVAS
jgi:N,N'-diacetyllegionaminate synthase